MAECETCKGTGEILKEYSEEEYEELLNEIYPEVSICGMMMQQGTILKEMDPIAFRCGLSEMEEYDKCKDCNGLGLVDDEEEAETDGNN